MRKDLQSARFLQNALSDKFVANIIHGYEPDLNLAGYVEILK